MNAPEKTAASPGQLSEKQKKFTVQFTNTEVVTLTIWGFLQYLTWKAFDLAIFGSENRLAFFGSFLVLFLISTGELYAGLILEHEKAVATGDFPLQGAVQDQPE